MRSSRPILFTVIISILLMPLHSDARGADAAMLTVRVVDAESGEPVPARLWLQASDDGFPGDRLNLFAREWPALEAHAVYIEGEQTFELPAGQTKVIAARGPDSSLAHGTYDLVAGKTATAELKLRRIIDLRKLGWVCGDAHMHMIHGEMQRPTSYADVALTCRAMGLDWAMVNQEYVGAGETDLAGLHAACEEVSTDDFQLHLGAERPKSLLGHHALIGVHNPFIIHDDPPYHAAARAVHEAGGVLFPVHPVRYYADKKYLGKWLDFPGNNLARELIFDAFCGPSFDGLSVLSDDPSDPIAHRLWINLLNRGLFVPAMTDSDTCFDRPVFGYHAPGFWRTYLHTGGKTDQESLAQAVRAGRTMATTGPLAFFQIDDQSSGATLPPDGAKRKVAIEVHAAHHNWTLAEQDNSGAAYGIAKVELLRNGEPVKTWEPKEPHAKLTHEISEQEACWYAVRVYGSDTKWQIGVASPIYFRDTPAAAKQPVLSAIVRGRIYDFRSGEERAGRVIVRRDDRVLKEFDAAGQFRVKMPIDATVSVVDEGERAIEHNLLLGYGPVHRFLWNLDRDQMADAATFEQLEKLVREVDLEFPIGHRTAGCYFAGELEGPLELKDVKVIEGPDLPGEGSTAVAALLLDASRVSPGDTINVAALFRHEAASDAPDMRLVVEGRAYNPTRPTGFNPLKVFASVEEQWSKAQDVGGGYRMVSGSLTVPDWADPGPVGAIEINVRSRGAGGKDGGHIGILVPLGKTQRTLAICTPWSTMPISWPDHNYGIGPLNLCGKTGREGQPKADYRKLHLNVKTPDANFDLLPARDAKGCPDADDAIYTGHFLDQVLNEQSNHAKPDPIRPQPKIKWRDTPLVDATAEKES